MNIALIIAGGSGKRMQQDIPKQFLSVENKPVIIYTLEAYQRNVSINQILVVCLEGWITAVDAYCRQFSIDKLNAIICGGNTRFESILIGLRYLKNSISDEDIVTIHDANRPLVTNDVIDDNIRLASQYSAAVAATPCVDAMYISQDQEFIVANAKREELFRAQSPESIKYKKAIELYEEYERKGGTNLALGGMLLEQNEKVVLSKGVNRNFKITSVEDLEMFQALLLSKNSLWIK